MKNYNIIKWIINLPKYLKILKKSVLFKNFNQDSIKLHRLKAQAQSIADQEEAITAQVARFSAPHMLAKRARVLGMVPSGTPEFLDLRPKVAPVNPVKQ